jgi:flagellar biosynthesis/type III secretory pathway protein FliH
MDKTRIAALRQMAWAYARGEHGDRVEVEARAYGQTLLQILDRLGAQEQRIASLEAEGDTLRQQVDVLRPPMAQIFHAATAYQTGWDEGFTDGFSAGEELSHNFEDGWNAGWTKGEEAGRLAAIADMLRVQEN